MLRSIKSWGQIAAIAIVACTIPTGCSILSSPPSKPVTTQKPNDQITSSDMFSAPLKTHNGEIEVFSYLPLNAVEPFQALAEALKIKPKAKRFRVTWFQVEPGGVLKGTMVYDKNRKLLKLFDDPYFQYLLTGVTDADISRYVKQYAKLPLPQGMGLYSFVGIFRTYGCKVFRSGRLLKKLRHKNEKPNWPDIQQDITQHHRKLLPYKFHPNKSTFPISFAKVLLYCIIIVDTKGGFHASTRSKMGQ